MESDGLLEKAGKPASFRFRGMMASRKPWLPSHLIMSALPNALILSLK